MRTGDEIHLDHMRIMKKTAVQKQAKKRAIQRNLPVWINQSIKAGVSAAGVASRSTTARNGLLRSSLTLSFLLPRQVYD